MHVSVCGFPPGAPPKKTLHWIHTQPVASVKPTDEELDVLPGFCSGCMPTVLMQLMSLHTTHGKAGDVHIHFVPPACYALSSPNCVTVRSD